MLGARTARRMVNRLAGEKSPYLLQHANNPVDWHPWGPEAVKLARALQRPIFLSVGYSTCHWCHVMERESFEDQDISKLLNENFVSIKVDREERPDIDRQYMLFVQATTGGGGWPMSVFLTPQLKPFFGGTYFPPTDRHGQPSFRRVLEAISQRWKLERQRLEETSDAILDSIKQGVGTDKGEINAETVFEMLFSHFHRAFDSAHGGFGSAPKFPTPVVLSLLLRMHLYYGSRDRDKSARCLEMVELTLRVLVDSAFLENGERRHS